MLCNTGWTHDVTSDILAFFVRACCERVVHGLVYFKYQCRVFRGEKIEA